MSTLGGFSDIDFESELDEPQLLVNSVETSAPQPIVLETVIVQNTGANAAPFFTEPAVFNVEEDDAVSSFFVQAFDPDGDPITFSVSGGADADDFQIDTATGEISFIVTPDFQAPQDGDGDNTYHVEITASDGVESTTLAVDVHVTEAPVAPADIEIERPAGADPFAPVFGFLTPFASGTLMDMAVRDDAGQAADTTFRLLGEDAFQFNIDASTGEVSIDHDVFLGGDGAPNADFSDLSFDGDAVYEVVVVAEHISGSNDTMALDFFLFIGG